MIRPIGANIRALTLVIALAFLATSVGVSYWTLVASAELSGDAFNPRLLATLLDRPRGRIVAADGTELAQSARLADGAFRRRYADRSLAQVVGYASYKYGAAGLEAAYAESLIGRDAADPIGQWRARYLREHPEPGSVRLGIVPSVQRAAAAALGGRKGAVIVLDPRSGAILASVSEPNYDPNILVDPAQQDLAWQQVNGDRERPLLDRATQGLYPPGSTFKIVTAAAALESGWDPKAKVRVDDPYRADPSWGGYAVRSPSQAHGDFDLSLAFQRSENIYFAKAGLATGAQRLAEYAGRFGIGTAPRCELAASKGQIATGTLDRPTLVADTSFGQGELLVSPLQMALVAATIARAGSLPTPHYATAVLDARGDPLRLVEPGAAGQVIRPDTAATIGAAMVAAVEAPGAFAFGARIQGVHVAGKTGTAEVPSGAPHGWFVGFAPAEAATAVVAVIIENTPKGGEDAAPVGGAVLRAAVSR
ncbi:MAG: penicillin-binding protein 2 [Chloroflexi bacterium]|nr:penicillin-binding protein 2 [Chloroflexota bacterium]MBI2982776.1 penicillin-binding protein 2 [Chloroflexota bacterium]